MERPRQASRWDKNLTLWGIMLVESKRRNCVTDYVWYIDNGFVPIGEISPFGGELVWHVESKDAWQLKITQGWAATRRISQMEKEDHELGRKREYAWSPGAVIPLRRLQQEPEAISSPIHVRAYRRGVTIFAKDMTVQLFEHAIIREKAAYSIGSSRVHFSQAATVSM